MKNNYINRKRRTQADIENENTITAKERVKIKTVQL